MKNSTPKNGWYKEGNWDVYYVDGIIKYKKQINGKN